ncbi:hypothetical protein C8F04DRAFT_1233004 [Mycena alexandri]|uniref:Uncharacterized protein n=1 Tax=Mycena alexandri TaxID=1745969 RepID=A0AAD6X9A5_9AGAR|nr:hypothetical protein C8F04DRAFT_1233004 [Mycena alexandri]
MSSQETTSLSHSISPISPPLNRPLAPHVLEKLPKSLKGSGTLTLRKGRELLRKHTAGSEHLWNEFRGRGAPPADEGRIGDVFWDITPPFVLYVRRPSDVSQTGVDSEWKAWNPDPFTRQPLAEHPLYEDRYLWISASGTGFEWFTRAHWKGCCIEVMEARALEERLLREVLASPKKVSSPKRITSSAGQPSNSDQAKKRKRAGSDGADSPPRRLQPPQTIVDIPATNLSASQLIGPIAGSATFLALCFRGDQLTSNIAAQDAALGDLQMLLHRTQVACEGMTKDNALEKEKEASVTREALQNELDRKAALRRWYGFPCSSCLPGLETEYPAVLENTRLKASITRLDAVSQEKLRHQAMTAQADKQARAKILGLETMIIELESVVSTCLANVQREVAGSLARFPKNTDPIACVMHFNPHFLYCSACVGLPVNKFQSPTPGPKSVRYSGPGLSPGLGPQNFEAPSPRPTQACGRAWPGLDFSGPGLAGFGLEAGPRTITTRHALIPIWFDMKKNLKAN